MLQQPTTKNPHLLTKMHEIKSIPVLVALSSHTQRPCFLIQIHMISTHAQNQPWTRHVLLDPGGPVETLGWAQRDSGHVEDNSRWVLGIPLAKHQNSQASCLTLDSRLVPQEHPPTPGSTLYSNSNLLTHQVSDAKMNQQARQHAGGLIVCQVLASCLSSVC